MPNFWRLNTMPLPKIQQLHWSMMIFGKKCIYLILYPLIGNLTTHIAKVNSMTYQLWRFMIGDTKLDFFCLNMRRFIFFSKNLHIRIVFFKLTILPKNKQMSSFFFVLTVHTMIELLHSFFGRIRGWQKVLLKLIDL